MKLNKAKSKSLTYMKWDLIKYSKKLFKNLNMKTIELTKEEIEILIDTCYCFIAGRLTINKEYNNKVIDLRIKLENHGKDISKT